MPSPVCLLRKPVSNVPPPLRPTDSWTVVSLAHAPAAEVVSPNTAKRPLDYSQLLELLLNAGKVITL
jgi:hypothetical protein